MISKIIAMPKNKKFFIIPVFYKVKKTRQFLESIGFIV
jgi:hypothetical protein